MTITVQCMQVFGGCIAFRLFLHLRPMQDRRRPRYTVDEQSETSSAA